MIVVLHRERSEKLARHFADTLAEQAEGVGGGWADLDTFDQSAIAAAFDALIQDGLISERQHRPEGRE